MKREGHALVRQRICQSHQGGPLIETSMKNRIRTIYSHEVNSVWFKILRRLINRKKIPDEIQRTHQLKDCEYKNEEGNSCSNSNTK